MAAGPSHPEVARREHHAPRVGYTLYGDSKLDGERLVFAAARTGDVEAVIVRPPAVYGPRDLDMLQMIRSAKFGVIAQPGLRPAWMSFIHALDLVEGIARAGARGCPIPATASTCSPIKAAPSTMSPRTSLTRRRRHLLLDRRPA
ncbi:NAD-dependent epimerase/dehydratase family protein [Nannocystis pusilla]|uniref:NAD-dependent epimerase/dehydratase family protein n=1 Tax=Nannocystis pusilla TaxID=889268 RepID=UPI003B7D3832